MKIVFKGWDDIDKIIQKGLPLFMRRRDGDIAPYRHYTREIRMRITPAHYARAIRTPMARAAR